MTSAEFTELKFLKTIRFDPSDDHVFERASQGGEWAIPGAFLHAQRNPDEITGKSRQAFRNGFFSIESYGFSTFVSVTSIDEENLSEVEAKLSDFLFEQFGAPDRQSALSAARDETSFVLDMCSDTPVNSVLAVSRTINDDGEIHEEFRIVQATGENPHARVWEIVEDHE